MGGTTRGRQSFAGIKTLFDFVNDGFVFLVVDIMYRAASSFWFLVYRCLVFMVGAIFRHVLRFRVAKSPEEKHESDSNMVACHEQDNHQMGSSCSVGTTNNNTSDGVGVDSDVMEAASSSASTNRYEFLAEKGVCGFVEEPKTMSFTVHESFMDSRNDEIATAAAILDPGGSSDSEFQEVEMEAEVFQERAEETVQNFTMERSIEKQEQETSYEDQNSEEKETVSVVGVSTDKDFVEVVVNEETFVQEEAEETEKAADSDQNSDIERSEEKQEVKTACEDMNSDDEKIDLDAGISSEKDVGEQELDAGACMRDEVEDFVKNLDIEEALDKEEPAGFLKEQRSKEEDMVGEEDFYYGKHDSLDHDESIWSSDGFSTSEIDLASEGIEPESSIFSDEEKEDECHQEQEAILVRDQSSDSDDEYIELEPQTQNSVHHNSIHEDIEHGKNDLQKSIEHELEEKRSISSSDFQDDSEDFMFEHDDLIEQLKMELKQARTGGLPTIPEESESEEPETPKTVPEIKPLQIDEKFEFKDLMEQIQKVYKGYSDRMKKLDILNFQSMHALGLLQLKDTLQWQKTRRSSLPAIRTLLLQNFLGSCKIGTGVVEPANKIIADMQREFEMVYVGQLCLSWEMLHWQFWKSQELHQYDSHGFHQYNQVANEFQLFQVLLHRFIENEPFQGPRVQNYVRNRCVVRSLLQVPVLKDDNTKDKGRKGDDDEDAITSQMLTDIIEESIRTFWEFLRGHKDESNVIFQGHQQSYVNFQDFVDSQLLMEVRTCFQKKEKKLKDILRSGNCIVKKFQKQKESRRHLNLTLLIAQVELKLVARVLNMSKLTTDQLIWCHEKLDKINFSSRKVLVQSSFCLFPC